MSGECTATATAHPLTTETAFERMPDLRCLRGLHFLYRPRRPVDPEGLCESLQRAFHHKLVRADEPWGARLVRRLVLQFRFEVRIGTREGEISFLHRVSARPDQRQHDTDLFEAVLREAVGAP